MTYVIFIRPDNKQLQQQKKNIDGSNDPFYRYKMRQLIAIPVGKGYTCRLEFQNIDQVAKDLHVDVDLILKWFSYDCNMRCSGSSFHPSLRGYCSQEKLSDSLQRFIKMIVLCPKCTLPELSYHADGKKIRLQCDSCGYYGRICSDFRNKKFEKYMFSELYMKQNEKYISRIFPKSKMKKDDWSVDLSNEACEKRQKELCATTLI